MGLLNWLDNRTGYRQLLHEALFERVPGGARWRYVWGSTLVFTFFTQVITGVMLMTAYSPSTQTAWESVYFIQHEMSGGWLLRGLHHFTAQAMVVLLALHLMQVVIDGAYRAPREINYWLGLVLMLLTLGLALTGYLLPWDQKGYYATRVATNLVDLTPVIGNSLKTVIVGGQSYGHHTLTRFYALHVAILPGALVGFLVLHIALFRKHGLCAKQPVAKPDATFWPDQVLKDAVACLAVLLVVLTMVVRPAFNGNWSFDATKLGAELTAPADPSQEYEVSRPEWYFLFLFQLLKKFNGPLEVVGAIIIPGAVLLLLALMPLVGRWRLGHVFNVGFLFVLLLGGVVPLTAMALYDDYFGPKSDQFKAKVAEAEADAERTLQLARINDGFPPEGALALVRNDPKIQGRRLFVKNCQTCHHGNETPQIKPGEKLLAGAKLQGFATRSWIAGLLNPDKVAGPDYFGHTAHAEGDMAGFVRGDLKEKWKPEEVQDVAAALSSLAQLPAQAEADRMAGDQIARGLTLIKDDARCAGCHKIENAGGLGTAPELTAYGSRQWLLDFIANPAHERFYGEKNDRMPAFAAAEGDAQANRLTRRELGLIADFLRGDWAEER